MSSNHFSRPAPEEIERLLRLTHHDPHSVLGAHPMEQGVVVRAYRPEAERVTLLAESAAPREMRRFHAAGLFETLVEGAREVFSYRLEARYPDGSVFMLDDPYRFLPTLGDLDLHLTAEGRHEQLYEKLGAHVREMSGVAGVSFAVWAPAARGVSIVGDFNNWDGRLHMMRRMGSGVWELFVPGIGPGAIYKYEIRTAEGPMLKSDPYAFKTETPPKTASIVHDARHVFGDQAWMKARAASDPLRRPISIYEVHLGSWRRVPEEDERLLTYRELAYALGDYVSDLGFTHVELMPVMEHPFSKSWGYQVSGFFAPTARHGDPDDFRFFVDHMHSLGVGVILDWVPAHFPKDAWALGRFDGTALYEHLDARQGEHPDWGTYVFNYGRNEVRNFLLANALYWLSEFHVDGLRLDAVASMLYLDYSRREGEWVPNRHGGRENLEALELLRELNAVAHGRFPGTMIIAEESTAWPGVSRPTYVGGLGFTFKWNMGWMHDTLLYFSKDPIHRQFHHNSLTFGFLYAWSENFVLPLSHDEVVHGKRSLLNKMPGDRWQRFANLRALLGYMWAHPGKKLLFMGGEIAQWNEWYSEASLDWHLLGDEAHRGVHSLVRDLNRVYGDEPALWEADVDPSGFHWIDANAGNDNVASFVRVAPSCGRRIVCVSNFSPVVRHGYQIGLPSPGFYREVMNTDAACYGGSNVGNVGGAWSQPVPWHGQPHSAILTLPPLATIWFEGPAPC
ncbi:MAG: 1,4-alpha-glucan branching protein GlgB [Vicinamibacteria bacterium]|nr:1,4-alpha-glucan branching protein GlgB [Vicinamibacteria bacterium]